MNTTPPDDPRVDFICQHIVRMSKQYGRRLVVADYATYRKDNEPNLPALTTVYRLFGSWPGALKHAGVEQVSTSEVYRTPDERLISALQQAARDLQREVLSSHAYDEYRLQEAPDLPSSSVIRKWLGRWEQAVTRAGLQPPPRNGPRKPTFAEITEYLRKAREQSSGLLTPLRYSEIVQQNPDDNWPEVEHIFAVFPNWETALRAADVEQADVLHSEAIWTTEEVRRIISNIERMLKVSPVTKQQYEMILQHSNKPLPSWVVVEDLLYGQDNE